jgi:hypothetical protein
VEAIWHRSQHMGYDNKQYVQPTLAKLSSQTTNPCCS